MTRLTPCVHRGAAPIKPIAAKDSAFGDRLTLLYACRDQYETCTPDWEVRGVQCCATCPKYKTEVGSG